MSGLEDGREGPREPSAADREVSCSKCGLTTTVREMNLTQLRTECPDDPFGRHTFTEDA